MEQKKAIYKPPSALNDVEYELFFVKHSFVKFLQSIGFDLCACHYNINTSKIFLFS